MSLPELTNLQAYFVPRIFHFKKPGVTSRGILHERQSWFLVVHQKDRSEIKGIGECAPLKGLSIDDRPDFEQKLKTVCEEINSYSFWLGDGLKDFPAIK